MSCWELLGIEPTKDTEAIKKAFSARSKLCHPEDDPQGFKRLRDAYRQAVQMAQWEYELNQYSCVSEETASEQSDDLDDQPCAHDDNEQMIRVSEFAQDEQAAEHGNDEQNSLWFSGFAPEEQPKPADELLRFDSPAFRRAFSEETAEEEPQQHLPRPQAGGRPKEVKTSVRPHHKIRWTQILKGLLMVMVPICVVTLVVFFAATDSDDEESPYSDTATDYSQMVSAETADYDIITSSESITPDKIAGLKDQALTIWNNEIADRLETLEAIKANTEYYRCPAAIRLQIKESEYNELFAAYKFGSESGVVSRLDGWRSNEEEFAQKQLLPLIKEGLLDYHLLPMITDIAEIVGLSVSDCQLYSLEYMRDHDEAKLDQRLEEYSFFAEPSGWS